MSNNNNRYITLLKLAFPICIGRMSAMLITFIDMMMVGTIGIASLAAIGLAGACYSLILSLVDTVSPTVQGIVARRVGSDSNAPKCVPVNAGLIYVIVTGIPITIISYFIAPWFFTAVSSSADVAGEATAYFQIVILSTIAAGANQCFSGFWRGVGKTKTIMWVVIFINILNVSLNYALVFGNFGFPALGSLGAGIGTFISIITVTVIWFFITKIKFKSSGLLNCFPSFDLIGVIFKKSMVLSAGTVLFIMGINMFLFSASLMGANELALANVLLRIHIFLLVLHESIGLITGTLVSRALGRGDVEDASIWGRDAVKLGVFCAVVIGLPFLIFPSYILSYFFTDENITPMSDISLMVAVISTLITSITCVLGKILICLGHGGRVMWIAFLIQWFFILPLVWFFGPYMNLDFIYIWVVYVCHGVISAMFIAKIWGSGRWKTVSV
ncbi:hypothetical protein A7985_22630 [Pseudoalteromonas luteoviolacea]|uniref:Multidrug-efflux transporter n=1 Tax=Pseudoalteromonas luteoviolacea TaxID=43657 RepID=A0A1C0TJZ7_9GAMM|nr:MATE family efflux transporter [Pseudoalteromonas luteoviolacea]OCQ18815.1 hypothetical protein A7985_22630 [Pseudoalteromonas luteoviolacea]